MISLLEYDKNYYKHLNDKNKREKEILCDKNSNLYKDLYNLKKNQIEALENLFNYIQDIKDDLKFSESLLQETSIDIKEILLELENINNLIKFEANEK